MVTPRTALSMGERQGDEEGLAESLDDQTLSILYRVLSHSDLSALIAALNNSEESLPVSDAAEEVVRRNIVEDDGPITPVQIKEKYIKLQHNYVPMLADGGIIHRDEEDNTIQLTERGEEVADVQAEIFKDDSSTSQSNRTDSSS